MDKNVGYHAGDLGKSEYLAEQSGGRSTGHFGTGTYFVSNSDKIGHYNSRDGKDAPKHIVDFSKYKLYKPYSRNEALNLHDGLMAINNHRSSWFDDKYIQMIKDVNKLTSYLEKETYGDRFNFNDISYKNMNEIVRLYNSILKYWKENASVVTNFIYTAKPIENTFNIHSYDDYRRALYRFDNNGKQVYDEVFEEWEYNTLDSINGLLKDISYSRFDGYDEDIEHAIDLLNSLFSSDKVDKALKTVKQYHDSIDKNNQWYSKVDSLSTVFMKALGYEGVDVRHIPEFDNFEYGSVIYDLKKDTIVESKQDFERFKAWAGEDLYNRYMKQRARMKSPYNDITWIMKHYKDNLQDFEDDLKWYESAPTNKQIDTKGKEGAEKIFEDSHWLVLKINTYESAVKYGKNTEWCITGTNTEVGEDRAVGRDEFNLHQDRGYTIYYYIHKGHKDKYALEFQSKTDWALFNEADYIEVYGKDYEYNYGDTWNPNDTGGEHPKFPNIKDLPDLNKAYQEEADIQGYKKPLKLVENLNYSSDELVNFLLNEPHKKLKFTCDNNPQDKGPFYILPDGRFLHIDETKMHRYMFTVLQFELVKKTKDYYDDGIGDFLVEKWMKYIEDELGWFRCNSGSDVELVYCFLPLKKPTQQQYNSLTKWFDRLMELSVRKVQIAYKEHGTTYKSEFYVFKDIQFNSDVIIHDIQRYYRTGSLYEKLHLKRYKMNENNSNYISQDIVEKIVKKGSQWQVQSEKGKNLGTYKTKAEAEKRLKQVHYFKYKKEKLELKED